MVCTLEFKTELASAEYFCSSETLNPMFYLPLSSSMKKT